MDTTTTYHVTGMTCDHCVSAVTAELEALDGVTGVHVQLAAGGASAVTVISAITLPVEQVLAALEEAGDYHLSDIAS